MGPGQLHGLLPLLNLWEPCLGPGLWVFTPLWDATHCRRVGEEGTPGMGGWGRGRGRMAKGDKGQPVPVTGSRGATPGTGDTPRDRQGRGGRDQIPCAIRRHFNPQASHSGHCSWREREGRLGRRAIAWSLCLLPAGCDLIRKQLRRQCWEELPPPSY